MDGGFPVQGIPNCRDPVPVIVNKPGGDTFQVGGGCDVVRGVITEVDPVGRGIINPFKVIILIIM